MENVRPTLTPSNQDYLKHIFSLTENGQPASTNALAERLGIAAASVTGMLQKLAVYNPPLVDYRKHQGVTLTAEGRHAALEVIRHHRLLESWLVSSLGYTWEEVHEEACRLEHVISEDLEARIAAALGNPKRDPHGHLIPDANLVLPVDETLPLSGMRPGQRVVIVRVAEEDADFLHFLTQRGLVPGTLLNIIDYSPYDHNLTVQVDGEAPIVYGMAVTYKIFVEVMGEEGEERAVLSNE